MNQRPIYSGQRVKSSSWLIVAYNSLTFFQSGYPHGIINFHVNDVLDRNRNKQDDPVLAGNYSSLPKWSWRVVHSALAPIQIDSCSATNSFNFSVLIFLGHKPTLLLAGWFSSHRSEPIWRFVDFKFFHQMRSEPVHRESIKCVCFNDPIIQYLTLTL